MPSGLIALLDDVATIAKLAASSIDDVGLAAGKATAKATGVVVDDTAVTPRYVVGLAPERELPIIGKIALGSLRNKLLVLLPAALLLTAFAPFLITPLLMIGGSYLAFEATEKILEKLLQDRHHVAALIDAIDAIDDPRELERLQVSGAIRTDFILSAEIMAIALASLENLTLVTTAIALVVVSFAITAGVYGVVALIVKLDDIGLHMAGRRRPGARAIGDALVRFVPKLLTALSGIGTGAMLWVGGGILLHGLEVLHLFEALPHLVSELSHSAAGASGAFGPIVEWAIHAIASAIVGLVIGGVIVAIVRRFTKHPEQFVVD
jgi:predicted DNA repair protein MutK